VKRKHKKTLDAIAQADGNVDMRKVEALIRELGGMIEDRGNGLYRAKLNDVTFIYDQPHPRTEIGRGLAKRLREFLRVAEVV
jgi:hypothetical protein